MNYELGLYIISFLLFITSVFITIRKENRTHESLINLANANRNDNKAGISSLEKRVKELELSITEWNKSQKQISSNVDRMTCGLKEANENMCQFAGIHDNQLRELEAKVTNIKTHIELYKKQERTVNEPQLIEVMLWDGQTMIGERPSIPMQSSGAPKIVKTIKKQLKELSR